MRLKMTKLEVWAAEIDDQPGELARTLSQIADFGVDLEGVITRHHPEKPGKGILYVAPLTSHALLDNITDVHFRRSARFVTLKVEGANAPGVGAKLTRIIAEAGVNLRGMMAAVIGRRFVCYCSFDSAMDMEKAITALEPPTKRHWRLWGRKSEEEKIKIPA